MYLYGNCQLISQQSQQYTLHRCGHRMNCTEARPKYTLYSGEFSISLIFTDWHSLTLVDSIFVDARNQSTMSCKCAYFMGLIFFVINRKNYKKLDLSKLSLFAVLQN